MSKASIDALFSPFEYKSLKLRNRLVMAPMTRYFSPEGTATDDVAKYYRRRSEGGVGLILSEGAFVDIGNARNHENIPWLEGERLKPWQKVIDGVHAAGGKMAPQLWHVGGAPEPQFPDSPLCADLISPSGLLGENISGGRAMTEEDIADVVASFVRTAKNVQAMGFDALEFHGAHGYLFDQFFWSVTNKRGDGFGGTRIGERTRFAVEVVKQARKAVGEDFVLLFRLSQWKMKDFKAKNAHNPDELMEWVQPLVEAGVDIFDCSQRRFREPEFEGTDLNLAGWIKKLTGQPTITVGSIGLSNDMMDSVGGEAARPAPSSIQEAAERVAQGQFDLVAIGRALIADPQWPNKVKEGRFDELKSFSVEMTQTLA